MTRTCGRLAAIVGVPAAVVIAMVVAVLLSRSYGGQNPINVNASQCNCLGNDNCRGRILIRLTGPSTGVSINSTDLLCTLQAGKLKRYSFAVQILDSSFSKQALACDSPPVCTANKTCPSHSFCTNLATVELLYSAGECFPCDLDQIVLSTLKSLKSDLSFQLFRTSPDPPPYNCTCPQSDPV